MAFGAATLLLAACGMSYGSFSPTAARYNSFFTPADHIDQLLEQDDVQAADQVLAKQGAILGQDADTLAALTAELDAALLKHASADLASAREKLAAAAWPAPYDRWDEVGDALDTAREVVGEFDTYHVTMRGGRTRAALNEITAASTELRRKVRNSVRGAFASYPLFSAPNFFGLYPVEIEPADFFKQHADLWEARVRDADAAGLARLFDYYKSVLPAELKAELAHRYVEAQAAMLSGGGTPGLTVMLKAAEAARQLGMPLEEMPGSHIALIDMTGGLARDDGRLDFLVRIDADVPVQMEQAEPSVALDSPLAREADVLILVDVISARTEQEVGDYETVDSEYAAGTVVEPNPAYLAAQHEVEAAAFELRRIEVDMAIQRITQTGGVLDFLLFGTNLVAETVAQRKLNAARARLQSEAPTIERPVYQSYSFRRARIEAAKEATVRYYVVDRIAGRYLRDNAEVRDQRSFTLVYELSENDRDRASHLAGTSSEAEVRAFERAPVKLALSDILGRLNAADGQSRPVPALAALRTEILRDRAKALAALESRRYDAAPLDDARFDSVVVVEQATGSGSGFYVREDLVLTNFHVVEGTSYPRLRTFRGEKTSGKVIAQDARLDLALIEVQARGKPVEFFTGRMLPLGASVEAIGHPEGYDFTITRGVVSAVRTLDSPDIPGSKRVRYVQTDAAINHGNSGGPIFMGDKVIGVNTFGVRKDLAENLNFAVHYAEVLDFLAKHGVPIVPQS